MVKPRKPGSCDDDLKRVSFEEFAREVSCRREALGAVEIPRNSGTRRTSSKRALLKAIEEGGGKW